MGGWARWYMPTLVVYGVLQSTLSVAARDNGKRQFLLPVQGYFPESYCWSHPSDPESFLGGSSRGLHLWSGRVEVPQRVVGLRVCRMLDRLQLEASCLGLVLVLLSEHHSCG
ncbi:hypothetical protein ASPBRDRAFT_43200 [Aspergillus brasiliensis CBS 101740]|uniref:Secreted protein n=1 Tax=Aspergillus brasiliensis (strain CBS 101740 / IMI 381727 / IBT 21946) TaxID=767769 RepID=A0A1L9UJG6_ASPBC|nr:hypothetical protein ASPBRDRAFT_43200 [Aspergillus brasiliensis CBS 101740]